MYTHHIKGQFLMEKVFFSGKKSLRCSSHEENKKLLELFTKNALKNILFLRMYI